MEKRETQPTVAPCAPWWPFFPETDGATVSASPASGAPANRRSATIGNRSMPQAWLTKGLNYPRYPCSSSLAECTILSVRAWAAIHKAHRCGVVVPWASHPAPPSLSLALPLPPCLSRLTDFTTSCPGSNTLSNYK